MNIELPKGIRQADETRNRVYYVSTTFTEESGEVWVTSVVHGNLQTLSYPNNFHRVAVIKMGRLTMLVSDNDIKRWVKDYTKPLHLRMQ